MTTVHVSGITEMNEANGLYYVHSCEMQSFGGIRIKLSLERYLHDPQGSKERWLEAAIPTKKEKRGRG